MKLWQKGLLIFLIGVALNMVVMAVEVEGLIRELVRVVALVGLVLVVAGLVTKK